MHPPLAEHAHTRKLQLVHRYRALLIIFPCSRDNRMLRGYEGHQRLPHEQPLPQVPRRLQRSKDGAQHVPAQGGTFKLQRSPLSLLRFETRILPANFLPRLYKQQQRQGRAVGNHEKAKAKRKEVEEKWKAIEAEA